ncbi:MAG: diaminopimelate decarboxylase, partial [Candidatus Eremiobacterota bacterium]
MRHSVGRMNQFGRLRTAAAMPRVDGHEIRALLEEFGSPLWILSEETLRRQYRKLRQAFELRYPRVNIAYSYKTNYLAAVCSVLHQEGAWAEVVSGMEYELARANGVEGSRIVFNGPLKTRDELRRAFAEGARVNLDCFEEIQLAEELGRERGAPVSVGLRVNVRL